LLFARPSSEPEFWLIAISISESALKRVEKENHHLEHKASGGSSACHVLGGTALLLIARFNSKVQLQYERQMAALIKGVRTNGSGVHFCLSVLISLHQFAKMQNEV